MPKGSKFGLIRFEMLSAYLFENDKIYRYAKDRNFISFWKANSKYTFRKKIESNNII